MLAVLKDTSPIVRWCGTLHIQFQNNLKYRRSQPSRLQYRRRVTHVIFHVQHRIRHVTNY